MLSVKKSLLTFIVIMAAFIFSCSTAYAYEKHGTIKSSETLIEGAKFSDSGTKTKVSSDSKKLELDMDSREGIYITEAIKSEIPFICYGVHWQSEVQLGANMEIYARISKDGTAWSNWSKVIYERDTYSTRSEDELNSVKTSEPMFVEESNYAQIKVVMSSDGKAKAALKKLRIAFLDGREGPTLEDIKRNMKTEQFFDAESSTELAPAMNAYSVSALASYPRPTTITRTQWGCPQGESSPSWTPTYTTVTHLVIHHEAGSNNITDPAATMRTIWNYHTYTRGWGDIGYNYVFAHDGTIFNGRANSNYLTQDTKAAHDGNNTGSMGISCMGNYHPGIEIPAIQPPQVMLEKVKDFLAWKAAQRGINPLGSAYYAGWGGTCPTIVGHRDVGSTACPGDYLYVKMQEIREGVNSRINQPSGETTIIDNDSGAPNYTTTGTWSTSLSSGYNGSTYQFAAVGSASNAVWTTNLATAGTYKVSVIYRAGTNRATAAKFNTATAAGTQSVNVNQTLNDLAWVTLGTWNFNAGNATVTLDAAGSTGGTNAVVIADAIMFEKIPEVLVIDNGTTGYAVTGTWSTSASGGYNGTSYQFATAGTSRTATWTFNLPSAGNWKVSVIYKAGTNRASSVKFNTATAAGTQSVYVNQTQNDLTWVTLGTWNFNAGSATVTLDVLGSSGGTSPVVIADAVKFEKVP